MSRQPIHGENEDEMTENRIRELDRRSSDGIEVTLLWDSQADRVFISVEDWRRGRAFRVDVDSADALDAFHHPYAYVPVGGAERALAA
jgi:hypothetical protein